MRTRVVQISSDSNIGGAGKCILTFLENYDREKFDICVIVPKNSLLIPEVKALGVGYLEAEHIGEKSLSLKGIAELYKMLKAIKPKIVHTHGAMSGRIAGKLIGAKVIFTRHSVFPPSPKISRGLGKRINGFVNNATADKIIAVAEAAKENLTDTGVSEKKIQVILNGVKQLSAFDDERLGEAKKAYGIKGGQKTVSIVARLNTVKGHEYFVKSAKMVIDSGIDAKFIIAGTGAEEENIKALIRKLDLEEHVVMAGFIADVEPLMNAMDIQVNCSFGTEATSLSLLEGMSIKKPAVVTDFGGNSGVIENGVNGFLVPVKNPEAMADRIKELLKNPDLYNQMAENCQRIYKEKFTSEVYTKNIEKIYMEVEGTKNEKAKV